MKMYKRACVLLLGLIAAAGAIETGYGWFTSSALIGIGMTLLIFAKWKEYLNEKKDFSNLVKHITTIKLDMHGKGRQSYK